MDVEELISKEVIFEEKTIDKKDELFRFLAYKLKEKDVVSDEEGFIDDLYKREEEISTGILDGFGIPHAQSEFILKPIVCFVRTSPMLDYVGLDDLPIEHVFLIGIPKNIKEVHLDVLSSLSRKLADEGFRERLKRASTKEDILKNIKL